jgi:hypothetical protein
MHGVGKGKKRAKGDQASRVVSTDRTNGRERTTDLDSIENLMNRLVIVIKEGVEVTVLKSQWRI